MATPRKEHVQVFSDAAGILKPAVELPTNVEAVKAGAKPKPQPAKPKPKVLDPNNMNVVEGETITEEEASRRTAGSRGDFVKANPTATVDVRATKAPREKKVNKFTPGVVIPRKMGLKEYGQGVAAAHSILKAHTATLGSVALRPDAQNHLSSANASLDMAKQSLGKAEEARRGVMATTVDPSTGQTKSIRISGDAEAGRHYDQALKHISDAHDHLADDSVTGAAHLHKLSVELPSDHIQQLLDASSSTRVVKRRAFNRMNLAGVDIKPSDVDLKTAIKVGGKSSTAVQKIIAGQKGVAKTDKFLVAAGKADASAPETETEKLSTISTGPNTGSSKAGVTNTAIDPRRRASSERTVDTSFNGADMSYGSTPKFDASSKVEGDTEGEAIAEARNAAFTNAKDFAGGNTMDKQREVPEGVDASPANSRDVRGAGKANRAIPSVSAEEAPSKPKDFSVTAEESKKRAAEKDTQTKALLASLDQKIAENEAKAAAEKEAAEKAAAKKAGN